MRVPPKRPARTTGRMVKKPVIPVWVALPVVCRTNHGMAISEKTLPTREMAFAINNE
jgi:hypothetical protein